MNLQLSYDDIKGQSTELSWPFFESRMSLNLYGIRSNSLQVDMWNDVLGVAYLDEFGNKVNLMHKATTKPGLYWLKNKIGNMSGTAILIPGFYRKCWRIGEHKNYLALEQNKPEVFRVWRDSDADGRFDYSGEIYKDVTGLNMHTESLVNEIERIGAYSAGCQVRGDDLEHFMVMNLIKKSAKEFGDEFSYKLFNERDFL